jgi:hypothetical protein
VSRGGVIAVAFCLGLLLPSAAAAADRGADGEFDKRSSSHFVLYQDVDIDQTHGLRGSRRFEDQVLGVLESAYDELDQRLGLRPRRPLTVVVYDPGVFDARFVGLFRFPIAGFYGGTIHVRGDDRVTESLFRVLHHELVHAAFDALAPSLALPAWCNEGLAEWFEARAAGLRSLGGGERAALAQVARAGGLFRLAELGARGFAGLGPADARVAYLQSHAFFDFLARRYGERRLRDLVVELLRTGDLARSFRRTYRADLAALEESFRAELSGAPRG